MVQHLLCQVSSDHLPPTTIRGLRSIGIKPLHSQSRTVPSKIETAIVTWVEVVRVFYGA
jgi:hypothetical protein